MRRGWVLVLAALLLAPHGAADGPASTPSTVEAMYADLDRAGDRLDRGNVSGARDAVDHAREAFQTPSEPASRAGNRSRIHDALDRLADDTDPDAFRTDLVRLDVALAGWAHANLVASVDDEAFQDARAWRAVLAATVDQPGRRLPYDRVDRALRADRAPSEGALETALDATLAFRLLEEVQAADDLQAVGDPVWREHATRAGILWDAVRPRARARLPSAAFQALDGNLSRLESRLQDRAEAEPLPGVRGPLTSLAYHRSIERLDEVGAGIEAGIFGVHRTVERDPLRAGARMDALLQDYVRHRSFLALRGEGQIQPLDRAVLRLNASVANGTRIDAAVREAAGALRDVALLDYGAVVEIETLAIRREQVHRGEVRLLRPPLEGLAGYGISIRYDPAVAEVVDVEPVGFGGNFSWSSNAGEVTLGASGATFQRGAIVALLHLRGAAEPGTSTPLDVTDLTLTTTRDEPAELFFVRNGTATVAEIAIDDDGEGSEPSTPGPGAGVLLAAVAGAVWIVRRRRS